MLNCKKNKKYIQNLEAKTNSVILAVSMRLKISVSNEILLHVEILTYHFLTSNNQLGLVVR